MRYFLLAAYLAIGAAFHWVFLGPIAGDLLGLSLLFAWPAWLFVIGFMIGFLLFVIFVAVVGLWAWIDSMFAWRRQRKLRRELSDAAFKERWRYQKI